MILYFFVVLPRSQHCLLDDVLSRMVVAQELKGKPVRRWEVFLQHASDFFALLRFAQCLVPRGTSFVPTFALPDEWADQRLQELLGSLCIRAE